MAAAKAAESVDGDRLRGGLEEGRMPAEVIHGEEGVERWHRGWWWSMGMGGEEGQQPGRRRGRSGGGVRHGGHGGERARGSANWGLG